MTDNRTETVTLQIPRDRDYTPILHMILGGVGLRRNLSFDALDDVQLAVDSVLDGDQGSRADTLTMTINLRDSRMEIELDGLQNEDLKATLEEGRVPSGAESRCLDVCVLLRPLVDGYSVKATGETGFAVVLEKSVH